MKDWHQLLARRGSTGSHPRQPGGLSLAGLVWAFVALDCGIAQAAIIEIPSLGGGEAQPTALSQNGSVAGLSITIEGEQHAYVFSGGSLLDLGTLGGQISQAWDLNGSDDVVGQSSLAGDTELHAFLFRNSQMLDLGTLGGPASRALAINQVGDVVGGSLTASNHEHAFLWVDGQMQDLGTLGGDSSVAFDINEGRQVTGNSLRVDGRRRAFLWNGAEMVDLGTLGGANSSAMAINGSGMVAGDSETANGESHAFLYENGQMHDIGTLGGTFSTAGAINDSGQVIGDSASHGFIYGNGVLTDLGDLGGGVSSAWGLNNRGQVVGYSFDANMMIRAFLWENGVMRDLNTLIPPDSGWLLMVGSFINDAGHIVGFGMLDGRFTQFLLTPNGNVNHPPVANAGADATVECSANAILDGSASIDPDRDSLTYEWSENGVVLGASATLEVHLALGTHNLRLLVSDSHGATSTDDVVVTVVDTLAPVLTCPVATGLPADGTCQAMVPDLRSRVVATDNCTDSLDLVRTQTPAPGTLVGLGSHEVTVIVYDASGNSNSCVTSLVVSDLTPPVVGCPGPVVLTADDKCHAVLPDVIAGLEASDNCSGDLMGSQTPEAGSVVSAGTHVITVVVVDPAGNRGECSVVVEVVDRTAPVFTSLSVTPDVLRSANKAMVPVEVLVQAHDSCDPAPVSRIVSIESSDPVTGPGDSTAPDFKITGPLTAELRAERLKTPRVYTLTIECRDAAGNALLQTVQVVVPKGREDWTDVAVQRKAQKAIAAILRRLR